MRDIDIARCTQLGSQEYIRRQRDRPSRNFRSKGENKHNAPRRDTYEVKRQKIVEKKEFNDVHTIRLLQ